MTHDHSTSNNPQGSAAGTILRCLLELRILVGMPPNCNHTCLMENGRLDDGVIPLFQGSDYSTIIVITVYHCQDFGLDFLLWTLSPKGGSVVVQSLTSWHRFRGKSLEVSEILSIFAPKRCKQYERRQTIPTD